MSTALFPVPEEPDGSGLGGDGWDGEEGVPQGLYVTLPAEELSLEGFAQDGRADTMAPARCWAWFSMRWPERMAKGWPGWLMTS